VFAVEAHQCAVARRWVDGEGPARRAVTTQISFRRAAGIVRKALSSPWHDAFRFPILLDAQWGRVVCCGLRSFPCIFEILSEELLTLIPFLLP
jgi:hypothetical protein